jgi:glycosyltransferase involved in cell wall biosynthesis
MLRYVISARRFLKKGIRSKEIERPDHTLCFFALPTGLIGLYLKKRFGIPYTISLRGGDVPGFLPKELWKLHALTMPMTKKVWRNATHIVANSLGLTELAKKTAGNLGREVICIPNGVDTNKFKPTSPNPASILFVGRLTEQKGLTYLLQALALIKTTNQGLLKQTKCTVIGDGPLRQSLEKESADLGLTGIVTFKGWVDRSEIPAFYAQHQIFAMPSFEEGMPNVILEAMASQMAIIATNIYGNDELVKDGKNGILIPPANPQALADAILRLLSDGAVRANMGRESRSLALLRGWDIVAGHYNLLLQSPLDTPLNTHI